MSLFNHESIVSSLKTLALSVWQYLCLHLPCLFQKPKFIIEKKVDRFVFPPHFPEEQKIIVRYFILKTDWLGEYKYLTNPINEWLDSRKSFPTLLDAIHYIYKKYNSLNIVQVKV